MGKEGQAKRVALYLRVSTGTQTTRNQQRDLEAVAKHHKWTVVQVFKDHGISGAKGREKRPGFDQLLRGVTRKDFDLVAAWSVDRLGRSLKDLLGFLTELKAKGVDLYLHQQGMDTSTPAGEALFQMAGVFSQFERAMIRDRVKAGLQRAKAEAKANGRVLVLGRPRLSQAMENQIREHLTNGVSIRKTATLVSYRTRNGKVRHVSPGTVQRIKKKAAAS